MTLRIGWLTPLTPASGVGTFSHAIARSFPTSFRGEEIDLTVLHPPHDRLHDSQRRTIEIPETETFHSVLSLFDLLIYNIGNNREHHDAVFRLLRIRPGIVICHDYVYQHYLADCSLRSGRSFASYAALLLKYGGGGAGAYLARSRITSRTGKIRYSPWDSEVSDVQPMSEAFLDLGSALVVHSAFAERHAAKRFEGPILRLAMPHDQKFRAAADTLESWKRTVGSRRSFHMVSFGHIQPTKCIDLVLSALAASKVLRRKLRYTIAGIVGDQHYYRDLQELVASASLGDVVTFEIAVSDARLADIMGEADLFVNLRKPNTEGSSASLIEQLDSGRPVMVLDSGCYAELGVGAAVKLPANATVLDIQFALEKLLARPEQMPAIGQAGRDHARAWSCASYSDAIVAFAVTHRDLLRRRGAALGIGAAPTDGPDPEDEAWLANLAGARATLRYLDRNMLALDPDVLMKLTHDDLCTYVAHVILGLFNDGRLQRALSRYFVGRDPRAAYWACVRFSVIVEAVFAADESARERLKVLGPCYDVEFWAVVEAFPFAQFLMTALLMMARRMPEPGELAGADAAADAGRTLKRRWLSEILKDATGVEEEILARLRRWLEEPDGSDLDVGPPLIDTDLDCIAGSEAFRGHVDLSGFHGLEADHVWTRGNRGFLGLRLGPEIARIAVRVRHVDAEPGRPAMVALSTGMVTEEVEFADGDSRWVSLAIPGRLAQRDATTWLQLSTSRAAPPPHSADPRTLGVCLLELRVLTAAVGAVEEMRRSSLA